VCDACDLTEVVVVPMPRQPDETPAVAAQQ